MIKPKEDKCRYCGQHLGWAIGPIGEALMLELCEKPECQNKARKAENEKNKEEET